MSANQPRRPGRGQRGATTAFIAVGLTALIGSAAVAIDLGHLFHVRTESQRVADLSALAGVGAYVSAPGPQVATVASTWATNYAAQNIVDQGSVTLLPSDVVADPANRTVTVTVRNTAGRGSAVSSIFSRIFNVSQTDVVTTATARAWPASGVSCVLPLFLVDRWDELGGNPSYFDNGTDYYEQFVPSAPTGTYTGYDHNSVGTRVLLKPAQGGASAAGRPNPSWYFAFDAANIPGGANYQASIEGCPNPNFIYSLGQQIWVEPGAMVGPTRGGFGEIIAQDPNAVWEPTLNCVVDAQNLGSGDPSFCRGSPRVRPVPMFDPSTSPGAGKQLVTINNFTGVFVEQLAGNEVWVVLMGYGGVSPGTAASVGAGSALLQVPRLIN